MKKITLDAREMEHPKPLELAIGILKDLDDESYLYMLHRKEPIPLIDLAKEQHFQMLSHQDTKKEWHILIAKNNSFDLKEYLSV
jgi:hypothetical protein